MSQQIPSKARRRWMVVLLAGLLVTVSVLLLSRPEPLHAGKPVSAWVKEWLEKPDQSMDPSAPELRKLEEIGAPAVECLIQTIQKRNFLYGSTGYSNLHARLPEVVSKRLPQPVWPDLVRIRAYFSLGALGPLAKPAVPVLVERLVHDHSLRSFATYTLKTLGTNAAAAVPSLLPALHSEDDRVVFAAAEAIAGIVPTQHEVVTRMQAALQSTNPPSRRKAARILGLSRPLTPSIEAALLGRLRDSDSWVRFWAAEALLKTGSTHQEPMDVMLTMVHGPEINSSGAFYDLAQVRPTTADICTVLVEGFKRYEPKVSGFSYFHRYFEEFSAADSNAIPALIKATDRSNSVQLRRLAAEALRRIEKSAREEARSDASETPGAKGRPDSTVPGDRVP